MKKAALYAVKRASNALFGPDLTHRSKLARRALDAWTTAWTVMSPAQRRQQAFERAHPDAPWLVPAAIPAIESALRPDFHVFEYGAGRSTLWFARRVAQVESVEGRGAWSARVRAMAADAGLSDKIVIHDIEIAVEHDVPDDLRRRYVEAIRVRPAGTFDVVLVDGHFRAETLREAFRAVKPGGLVVLDNADQMGLEDALAEVAPFLQCSFSNGIWQTTLYRVPNRAAD